MLDLAIVGAGPVGLAAGVLAQRAGLKQTLYEKGSLLNTLYRWPRETVFFSEARNLEIGGHPFPAQNPKPTRREALAYYRRVAEVEQLPIQTYSAVERIVPKPNGFELWLLHQGQPQKVTARKVLVATGYYDNPNRLQLPGAHLPHVLYGIEETLPFWGQRVVVVGGSNSAIETALDLYRGGARVTVVHRGAEIRPRVKYWLKPDFENRVKEGAIQLVLNANIESITANAVNVHNHQAFAADFVVVLIGYTAADALLRDAGVRYDPQQQQPTLDEHFQTSLPGLFVAGSAGFGSDTRTVFIENGRDHAASAVAEIVRQCQLNPQRT